jgi:hypothetical protein
MEKKIKKAIKLGRTNNKKKHSKQRFRGILPGNQQASWVEETRVGNTVLTYNRGTMLMEIVIKKIRRIRGQIP